jgi:hypothetical protein
MIHAGLNLALHGEFNDIMLIGADPDSRPVDLSGLYEAIFDIARECQTPNRSLISLAMIADLDVLFSSGVKISPIKSMPRPTGPYHRSGKYRAMDGYQYGA